MVTKNETDDSRMRKFQIMVSAAGAAITLYLAASGMVSGIRDDFHSVELRVTALEERVVGYSLIAHEYKERIVECEQEIRTHARETSQGKQP